MGYRIEFKAPGGSWQVMRDLPAEPGNSHAVAVEVADAGEGLYRVIIRLPSGEQVLESGGGAAVLSLPSAWLGNGFNPDFLFSMGEPFRDTVRIRVSLGDMETVSATYSVDGVVIGQSTSGFTKPLNWDTTKISDGEHVLSAVIRVKTGEAISFSKPVTVDSKSLQVALKVYGDSGVALVKAQGSAEVGIRRMTLLVDGERHSDVLTAPNGCWASTARGEYCDELDGFLWDIDSRNLSAGKHELMIRGEDNAGLIREKTLNWTMNNPPELTLTQQQSTVLNPGTITFQGSFSDDGPGARLTVRVGVDTIFETTQSPFIFNLDTMGRTDGDYRGEVRVWDAAGRSTIKTFAFTRYSGEVALMKRLDPGTAVVSVLQGQILLRGADKSYSLLDSSTLAVRPVSAGNGITVQAASQPEPGRLLLTGVDSDGVARLYLWDGSVRNLSALSGCDPVSARGITTPVLSGMHAAWGAGSARYCYLNLDSGVSRQVTPPSGSSFVDGALSLAPDGVRIFLRQNKGVSLMDILMYDVTTDNLQALTTDGRQKEKLAADGAHVAWVSRNAAYGTSLIRAPVTSPFSQTLVDNFTSDMNSHGLIAERGGTLLWSWFISDSLGERDGYGAMTPESKLNHGCTGCSTVLMGEQGVYYLKSGSFMRWHPGSVAERLLSMTVYNAPAIDEPGGAVYRIMGGTELYRFPLP